MSINTLIISTRPTSNANDHTWELTGLTGGLILASWIAVIVLLFGVFCLVIAMCVDLYRTHRYPVTQPEPELSSEDISTSAISKRTENVLDIESVNGYE